MVEPDPVINQEEQIQIRKARKNFIALAISYFLGVFNDNFFKQAICLLAVAIGKSHFQGNAVIIFSIPFLIFAAPAGWLSDKFSKRSVVVWCKGIEILAMAAGAYGIMYDNWLFIFGMLFIMATQSTLVSPALNGAIPELYPSSYVTRANSIVKLVSTSAILAGIALAGPAIDFKSKSERPAVELNENRIKMPIDFAQYLLDDKDPISISILSEVPPENLKIPKKIEKPIGQIIGEQVSNNINKLTSIFKEDKNELSPEKQFEKNLNIALLASINNHIKSGKIIEFTKDDPIYKKNLDKLSEEFPNDPEYSKLLASTKYIVGKYDGYIEKTEITSTGKLTIAVGICLVAIFGWLISLGIPHLPAAATSKRFPFSGPVDTIKVVWNLRNDYLLAWTFIGSAFFYSIANLIVLNINSMGVSQFHFTFFDTSMLVVSLLVGICIGSLVAGRISKEHNWYKILPPSLLLMGVFCILIFFSSSIPKSSAYSFLCLMMVATGVGGGLFIIPMESFCQTRPEPSRKGEILAAHNFVDFFGLTLSGLVFNILSEIFTLQSTCIAFLGITIVITSIIIFIAFRNVAEIERKRKGMQNG